MALIFVPAISLAIDSVPLTETEIQQLNEATTQIENAKEKLYQVQIKIIRRVLPIRSDVSDSFLRGFINLHYQDEKLYCTFHEWLSERQIKNLICYPKDDTK